MNKVDSKLPIKMSISIASANEAIRYWLEHVMFMASVKIEIIEFDPDTHFTITLDREVDE